jgi:hypothetical protein
LCDTFRFYQLLFIFNSISQLPAANCQLPAASCQ